MTETTEDKTFVTIVTLLAYRSNEWMKAEAIRLGKSIDQTVNLRFSPTELPPELREYFVSSYTMQYHDTVMKSLTLSDPRCRLNATPSFAMDKHEWTIHDIIVSIREAIADGKKTLQNQLEQQEEIEQRKAEDHRKRLEYTEAYKLVEKEIISRNSIIASLKDDIKTLVNAILKLYAVDAEGVQEQFTDKERDAIEEASPICIFNA